MDVIERSIAALVHIYRSAVPDVTVDDGQSAYEDGKDNQGFYSQVILGWTSDQDPALSDTEMVGLAGLYRGSATIRHSIGVFTGDTEIEPTRRRASEICDAMISALRAAPRRLGVAGVLNSYMSNRDLNQNQLDDGSSCVIQFDVRIEYMTR